jgi:hypothetical protein
MGYYMCFDRIWLSGKAPSCKYCADVATWEAPTLEILLCDNPRCHAAYIADEGYAIDYVDETPEWRRCNVCGEVWLFVDETCEQCLYCGSDDTGPVDEGTLVAEG